MDTFLGIREEKFSKVSNYIADIDQKEKAVLDADDHVEQGGITDMTFQFEDCLGNDTLNGTYVVETETETVEKGRNTSITGDIITIPENNLKGNKEEAQELPASSNNYHEEKFEKEKVTESFEIIKEMSEILNTRLSDESLKTCLKLIEEGADYVALAGIIKKWRLSQVPKPVRKLGHLFDPVKDSTKEKAEWIW